MAPPCLNLQEKFFSFPGWALLDSSFSSSPSQGSSHLCFGCIWQVMGAPWYSLPREFLPFFALEFFGKVLAAPLICGLMVGFSLSGAWKKEVAICGVGTKGCWMYIWRPLDWECGWECGFHLLGLGRKCNIPGWNPSPLLSQHDSTK